jgi:hypothetical protein
LYPQARRPSIARLGAATFAIYNGPQTPRTTP